jgi:hypothetical protein
MRLDTGSSYAIEPGFSGGGLWAPEYDAVVGLVGQAKLAGDRAGDGRALTLRQIAAWLPKHGLHEAARWSVPAAGEAALAAWGWTLADDVEAGGTGARRLAAWGWTASTGSGSEDGSRR